MATEKEVLSGVDYHEHFNVVDFQEKHINIYELRHKHWLQCYYEAFDSLQNDLSILEFGSGPTLTACIPATTKASSIVLSDYTEPNCTALRQWLAKEKDAYDWRAFFKRILTEFEGKDSDEEVLKKMDEIRRLVKAVVHCDITQDPPIESGYDQQYDVVMTTMVICVTSQCLEDYRQGVMKLAKLVKPGGTLMIYDAEVKCDNHKGKYYVGTTAFQYVGITKEFGVQAMKDAGFTDIHTKSEASPGTYEKDKVDPMRLGQIFMKGTKN